jgi:hypothetical protein
MDFEKYRNLLEKINPLLNSMWNKVTFTTVADVLNKDIDLDKIDQDCWALIKRANDSSSQLTRETNELPDEEYDAISDEYYKLNDELYRALDKLSAIDSVVSSLKNISEKADESNFNSLFSDIPNINIDESFSFIKLKRFSK